MPRHRRAVLVALAVALVAVFASACLPPPPAPQSTITHCPLDRFSYGAGFTPPTHYGDDLKAPYGAPLYAVRNGTLWYWSTGDVGGSSVYLKADDGNTYYYTHLRAYPSFYENTTRPVKAGDVIEFVDHTGDADGLNHVHFEVRLGGPNGTRVDPWPVLVAAGCDGD